MIPAVEIGVGLPLWSGDWPAVRETALRAEQDGADLVWVGDHLDYPRGAQPLESWTVLSAVAALTDRVGLAAVTLSVPFRPPSVVAKMATALQHVSGGRLRLLLGAGADEAEHVAYGLWFGTPGERVALLEDAMRICRALLESGGGPVDLDGQVLRLSGAVNRPAPPVPVPLGVGGTGPRVRRLAAHEADELCVGLVSDVGEVFAAFDGQDPERRVRRSVFAPFVARGARGSALVGHPRDLNVAPLALADQLRSYRAAGVETVYVVPVGSGAYGALALRLPDLQAG